MTAHESTAHPCNQHPPTFWQQNPNDASYLGEMVLRFCPSGRFTTALSIDLNLPNGTLLNNNNYNHHRHYLHHHHPHHQSNLHQRPHHHHYPPHHHLSTADGTVKCGKTLFNTGLYCFEKAPE